nr:hypothetical protein [uncultured Rhodopila sp.]
MLAAIINKTPEEWLREIGEPPDKIAEVLNSFQKGAALRVGYYRPDHLFVRFHGAKASKKPRILHGATVDNRIYLPNYWMDGTALSAAFARASQFEGWATDAIISKIARNYYREIAAICYNWNDLAENELWKIELRGSEFVVGLEGPVAPQPTFAATKTEPALASIFLGGGTQVYLFPQTPFICTPVNWNAM